MNRLSAYQMVKEEDLLDLHSKGYILKHKKSGARIVVISNQDENKVFSIGFRTSPFDDTGVPHIIEHSVLCGSRLFPVKDPFIELAKGSLNTFLNAMTYPDKTVYPIASCNDKDFQNLMHVYLDSVFYPNIYQKKEIFEQEGWHYEIDEETDELSINGVVYSEMKGVYSSPEAYLDRLIQQSLFPDTTYGCESGGDPDAIPELTYEKFLQFHKSYYHPTNSFIYLYGDMNWEEKLAWMDEEYLSHFEEISLQTQIPMQQPFTQCKEMVRFYSTNEQEDLTGKCFLNYNVVVDQALNRELYIAFQILDRVLLSAPGAPLYQALVHAGIGDDIGGGYENGILQPFFSITAKNAKESQKDEFLRVIRETLEQIVKKGVDEKSLLAAINGMEFQYREADFGRFPKGLMYGLQSLDSWLYDDNEPFMHICCDDTFQFLRKQIGNGSYFEKLIEQYLLNNTHASVIVLLPKPGLNREREEKLHADLQAYKKTLSQEQIQQMKEEQAKLRAFQETPCSPEELAKIPMLNREDLKKECREWANEERSIADIPVVYHKVDTNRIVYYSLLFDVSKLKDAVPYLSLLSTVLGYVDTEHYTYHELSNEVFIYTGGITTALTTFERDKKCSLYFEFKSRVLGEQFDKSLELIQEMLQYTELGDEDRLREILLETRARMQATLPAGGDSTARMRSMSYFSESSWLEDQKNGVGYYHFICELCDHYDEYKEHIKKVFQMLMHNIFRKEHLMVSLTGDEDGYELLNQALEGFKYSLCTRHIHTDEVLSLCHTQTNLTERRPSKKSMANEGFMTPGKVQYVARSGEFDTKGIAYHGAMKIASTILSRGYLWDEVRVKGGAYGASALLTYNGEVVFSSYRDPKLKETMACYEAIPEFLESFNEDERGMTKYIIGTISTIDKPLTPSTMGMLSMHVYMSGRSQEFFRKERDQILNATVTDIRNVAKAIKAALSDQCWCVVGSEQQVEENQDMFGHIEQLG